MQMTVNGIEFNVETRGHGSPLLLLHGFTGAMTNWQPFVASWSRSHYLIMVDIIGHGASEAPNESGRYVADAAAADLVGILDAFAIERTQVLGYSMGGRLALTLAARYPERVEALILEGSSPGLAERGQRQVRVARDEALAEWIERAGIPAFVDYWENIPLFASQKKLPASAREQVRAQRLQNSVTGLANSLRGMGTGAQASLWAELPNLYLPVLLLTGMDDTKFCHIANEMHRLLPNAELKQISGAGHTTHLEQPDIFDTMVKEFLHKKG